MCCPPQPVDWADSVKLSHNNSRYRTQAHPMIVNFLSDLKHFNGWCTQDVFCWLLLYCGDFTYSALLRTATWLFLRRKSTNGSGLKRGTCSLIRTRDTAHNSTRTSLFRVETHQRILRWRTWRTCPHWETREILSCVLRTFSLSQIQTISLMLF